MGGTAGSGDRVGGSICGGKMGAVHLFEFWVLHTIIAGSIC